MFKTDWSLAKIRTFSLAEKLLDLWYSSYLAIKRSAWKHKEEEIDTLLFNMLVSLLTVETSKKNEAFCFLYGSIKKEVVKISFPVQFWP